MGQILLLVMAVVVEIARKERDQICRRAAVNRKICNWMKGSSKFLIDFCGQKSAKGDDSLRKAENLMKTVEKAREILEVGD